MRVRVTLLARTVCASLAAPQHESHDVLDDARDEYSAADETNNPQHRLMSTRLEPLSEVGISLLQVAPSNDVTREQQHGVAARKSRCRQPAAAAIAPSRRWPRSATQSRRSTAQPLVTPVPSRSRPGAQSPRRSPRVARSAAQMGRGLALARRRTASQGRCASER